jgi:hypothetical protein
MKTLLSLIATLLVLAILLPFGQKRIVAARAENDTLRKAIVSSVETSDTPPPRVIATEAIQIPPAPKPMAKLVSPDPNRNGGWVISQGFFYMPKTNLAAVKYRPIEGNSLTDEAAALFGLAPAERHAVNRAISSLFEGYRKTEGAAMKPVEIPAGWVGQAESSAIHFDSGVAMQIPDLSDKLKDLRADFSQHIDRTLRDPARAQSLEEALDRHFDQQFDDLGRGQRTIAFMWQPEKDGTKSLWYGIASARDGEGSFSRVPANLDPSSQMAYYASLLGVQLPVE